MFVKLVNKLKAIFNGYGVVSMTLSELKSSQMMKCLKMKLSSNSSSQTLSMKKLWMKHLNILSMDTTVSQYTNIQTILMNGDYAK